MISDKERFEISLNQEDVQNIINCYEKDIEYIKELEEQNTKLKQENENLRETIKNDDLTINKLCKENKILRENAEHNDKLVDDYWWENKHYKYIIDELEKWLKDIKEGIEELTIDFQEWGHPAKPSIVIDDVLNKLQELKGDVDDE